MQIQVYGAWQTFAKELLEMRLKAAEIANLTMGLLLSIQ